MGLCPHKIGIYEFDLGQVFQPFQTECHQFSGLQSTNDPVGRGIQVPGTNEEVICLALNNKQNMVVHIPFTKSAEVNNNLLRDVLCDVNLRPEARHTHV